MKRFTLKDLARLTNLSVNTVSRALNTKDGVSRETRELIERIAKENNYRPNLLARSMRGLSTNLIGICVAELSNPFYIRLIEGAEEYAAKEGVTLLIGNSNENPDKEKKEIDAFLSYRCSGILLCPVGPDRATVETLKREQTNFAILDRPFSRPQGFDQVSIDNEAASRLAVEHLIKAGHRKIAIINTALTVKTEAARFTGYKRALEAHGIPFRKDFVKYCETRFQVFQAAVDIFSGKERPTAVFIIKQLYGLGVVSAVQSLALRIPEDVSVIVFGEAEWADVFHPKITCVRTPVRELGETGMRLLLDRIKRPEDFQARNLVLESELVERESVRILKS